MRTPRIFVALLALAAFTIPAGAQKHYPTISARQFTSGSVHIKVTGAFSLDQDVKINTAASVGDGEMTWLQFGASGGAQPNATITFTDGGEVGIVVAQGTVQGVAGIGGNEKPWCTGKLDVADKLITGTYTCADAASYDRASGRMGKVNIEVKITAGS